MSTELPRLWDVLTGGVGLGAIFTAVGSWAAQKQKLEDVVERLESVEQRVDKVDERSRMIERIDERTKHLQAQHAEQNAKLDMILREVRSQFDRPR